MPRGVFLADHAGFYVQRFKITSVDERGRKFTTIEEGRGRAPNMLRDWEEARLNATYNAVYKHVDKPRGRSNPRVVPFGNPRTVYLTPTGLTRIEEDSRGRTLFRDTRTGRFTRAPQGEFASSEELMERF